MRWAGHVALTGEVRGLLKFLVGKFERKILLGRSRHRWEGIIKIFVKNGA
jgi:hypothetical protein